MEIEIIVCGLLVICMAVFLFVKKKQRIPGDHIGTVIEVQSVFFQRGDQVDAVAFDAGVHPIRHPARLTV